MANSRYVVGIDLGTTNSALAYVDTASGEMAEHVPFPIPQVTALGEVQARPLLPSFIYLPGPGEVPAGSLRLPWDANRDYAIGEFARQFGSQVPTRLIASAKSWLCHPGIDRRAAILPWKSPDTTRHLSPLDASTLFLKHLVEAWNETIGTTPGGELLQQQEIVLTVPASFDAAARELTVEAARAAGLEHLTLLEEPQAAFYAWLDAHRDTWRGQVQVGELILVVDVGGGTTDFSLIEVGDDHGTLTLTRQAVGDHLLLGGDNMDLALAYAVAAELAKQGTRLSGTQILLLSHSCRVAKEQLYSDPTLTSAPVTVLGRGSRVIGGSIKGELTRAMLDAVLVEGFFPRVPLDAVPTREQAGGLQEIGLPYAADPAITRQLAYFLSRQSGGARLPSAVLFNGGVFKAAPLRQRVLDVLNDWAQTQAATPAPAPVRELAGTDLDLAVARGAAYYAQVRRGKGVRIRGGTARAYYIGIETARPAIPGAPPPLKALCVAPFGMEEGSEAEVPGREFNLVVGEPVEFRFLGSSVRRTDSAGTLVEDWDDDIEELQPVRTALASSGREDRLVRVKLQSRLTEVGQLELWCISANDPRTRWKLEYNVRQRER